MRKMEEVMVLKNHATATRISYLRGIRELMCYHQQLPEECTVEEIITFLVFQRDEQKYSASTVNLRVCGLKYYFRHVVHRLDLVVKIPNPRVQKYDTEIVSCQEMWRLRRACRDMRQLLLLTLLYDTGIRVREVVRLRVSDFDKYQRSITIRNSKGNKTRVVYYGNELRNLLNRYVKARGSVPTNTLFESYVTPDTPLSKRGVQHIIRQIVRRSGIKKRISPHTLRHTFAVHFLNAGGTLFQLQKLLGHENLTTTLHYLDHAQIPDSQWLSVLDELMAKVKK